MNNFRELLEKSVKLGNEVQLTLGNLLMFLLALVISWLVTRIFVRILYNSLRRRQVEGGKVYAITRIVKYVLYALFFMIALQFLHLNIGGLLIGASALLIGIGIGLQQIFYDFFSGLILLFERKVQVGDYVDIDGMVGRVDRIDLRTSVVRSLDNISVIVPNSRLISQQVINWSHNQGVARFSIMVGVVYGSNVKRVREALVGCALSHEKVLRKPAPNVLFRQFTENSMKFELMFWTKHFREIEMIRSDLHFAIEEAFREHGIVIAYQQIDVHLKRD